MIRIHDARSGECNKPNIIQYLPSCWDHSACEKTYSSTHKFFSRYPAYTYWKSVSMTTYPLCRTICCACLIIICIAIMPAGAIELNPTGSSSSSVTIANGDSVFIHGIATGQPRGLQLWIISHNYLKVTTLPVNNDDTYLYELKPADTLNLASGQYFFVVQHPMMNGQFDIIYNPSTGEIINKQLDGGTGKDIFKISGAGSLQGPDSAQALVNAISSQNIDDTFATYSFYISPPNAFINPVGDHYVGDKFTLSGSTNLAVGDELMVEVVSSSFKPTQKSENGEFSGISGTVKVVPGSGGYNRWSFDVNTTSFKPDEYIVKVSGIVLDVTSSTYFNLLNSPPPTSATSANTVPVTISIMTTTPQPISPTTTPQSPLPCWIAVSAVLAGLAYVRKKD
jgi:S-layer glycoprotein